MKGFSDPSASKISTSISISSDLLREANKRQIDISQALESYLVELLRKAAPSDAPEAIRVAAEACSLSKEPTCLFSGGWRHF